MVPGEKKKCVHCGGKFSTINLIFVKKPIGGWYKRGWFCLRRDKCDIRRTEKLPAEMRTALTTDDQYGHVTYKVGGNTLSPNNKHLKVLVRFPDRTTAVLRVVWKTIKITEEANRTSDTSRAYAEIVVRGALFQCPLEELVILDVVSKVLRVQTF